VYQGAGTLQQNSVLACVDPTGFLASFCPMGVANRRLIVRDFAVLGEEFWAALATRKKCDWFCSLTSRFGVAADAKARMRRGGGGNLLLIVITRTLRQKFFARRRKCEEIPLTHARQL
jgi:hypothetical protein